MALGFADGSLRLGRLRFVDTFPETPPEELRSLAVGESRSQGESLAYRTPQGQIRYTQLQVSWADPLASGSKDPIRRIDFVRDKGVGVLATLHESEVGGDIRLHRWTVRKDLVSGKESSKLVSRQVAYPEGSTAPKDLVGIHLLSGGKELVAVAPRGPLMRFHAGGPSAGSLLAMQVFDEIEPSPVAKSALILGRETLVVARESGQLAGGFLIRGSSDDVDGRGSFAWVKHLESASTAPAALSSSQRSRLLATLTSDGSLAVHQVTTQHRLAKMTLPFDATSACLALSPRDDGLVVAGADRIAHYRLNLGHPEAALSALFEPTWYEGYPAAVHAWQSDTTIGGEPKLGMMPLVFGTLKATVYSMLFGVPLAILAAIYTSEFLNTKVKARIKPTIELMAGLPSVVLGFIGAMVLAPWVAQYLTSVIAAFVTVPIAFLLAGHFWQMLPSAVTLRLARFRFPLAAAVFPLGLWSASVVGPMMERVLFAGDLMRWLDRQGGAAWGGWVLILLPLAALATVWIFAIVVDPWLRPHLASMSRSRASVTAMVRFLAALVSGVAIAGLAAALLSAGGWDPRGTVVDTFVQRNSLVVGFVMGFAIIPIIYTLADDALSSVPEHLRSASLGAGATPWQTAVRIVVPTAMSGLFSAVMIGLGRAVGETMIVLMAAGSTPIMEWNIFNGFRTLSANIAIELPEAVQGSTHYRTLFLAAVTLLALTSILNTCAELVRIRFRKRAVQL
jgi:phosphate transport system permease protein